MNLIIKVESVSKTNSKGMEADLLILTLKRSSMMEIKTKFPDKPVMVMNHKEYGFMDVEVILSHVMSYMCLISCHANDTFFVQYPLVNLFAI